MTKKKMMKNEIKFVALNWLLNCCFQGIRNLQWTCLRLVVNKALWTPRRKW